MRQERRPHLPLHRVLVLPVEVPQLQRLLELLEQRLHLPARLVQLRNRCRRPLEVVRQEHQLAHLPVHFHPRADPPQRPRILLVRLLARQHDAFVGEDAGGKLLSGLALHHPVAHGVLRPDHEEHALRVEPEQLPEVDVGAVENRHVPGMQVRAEFRHLPAIRHLGGRHEGEGRQAGGHVATHVELGGGFPPAVFGPVDGVERQLQHRCIHREDAPEAETGEFSLVGTAEKVREVGRQTAVEFPVEAFRDGGVALAVGIGKGVALGGKDAADAEELLAVDLFGVADFVEAEGARELAEEEGVDLVGVREDAGLDFGPLGEAVDETGWNEMDNLGEDGETAAQRFGCCWCFHAVRLPRTFPIQQPFFCARPTSSYGMAV